jgi:hypothetical protein
MVIVQYVIIAVFAECAAVVDNVVIMVIAIAVVVVVVVLEWRLAGHAVTNLESNDSQK